MVHILWDCDQLGAFVPFSFSLLPPAQDPESGCASEEEEEEEELCSEERTGADQRYDQHMDEAAEEEGLQRYRDARANEMFPDEVDTPLDVAARIRSVFVRCRAGCLWQI